LGGSATPAEACEHIWNTYEQELRESGKLFFTWQYDVRWAALVLRKNRIIKPAEDSPRGVWELANPAN
jgi:hypothetical protein